MAAGKARSPSEAAGAGGVVEAETYLREAAALVEAYLGRVLPAPGGHIPRLAEGWRGGEDSGARFEREGGPQRQDPEAWT